MVWFCCFVCSGLPFGGFLCSFPHHHVVFPFLSTMTWALRPHGVRTRGKKGELSLLDEQHPVHGKIHNSGLLFGFAADRCTEPDWCVLPDGASQMPGNCCMRPARGVTASVWAVVHAVPLGRLAMLPTSQGLSIRVAPQDLFLWCVEVENRTESARLPHTPSPSARFVAKWLLLATPPRAC